MRPLQGEVGGCTLLLLSAGSALLAACGPPVSGSREPPAASPASPEQTIAPTSAVPAIPTVSPASVAATPAPTPAPQLSPTPPPRPAPSIYPIQVRTPPGLRMAPGTCVAFAPAQADRHQVIFIDPGHGGTLRSGSPALTPLGAQYNHYLELGPAYPNLVSEASAMPGVIAEMLFISNRREADIASSPLGQQALARGIARGATDYLGPRA